jgi:hypothetical protein
MKDFQRIAGVAALYQAAFVIAVLVFFIVSPGAMGLSIQDAIDGNSKYLAAQATYRTIFVLQTVGGIAYSAAILVLALALSERWRTTSVPLARTATAAALVASTAFLLLGISVIVGMPSIIQLNAQDHTQGYTAWVAFNAVTFGFREAANFALGGFLILIGWVMLRARDLPRPLAYVAILAGAASLIRLVFPPLGLVGNVALIVWVAWIGFLLLRSRSLVASSVGSAVPARM